MDQNCHFEGTIIQKTFQRMRLIQIVQRISGQMSVSPAENSTQEINRVVMVTTNEKVHPYSRKSSMGVSDQDNSLSDQKMSRRLITCKIKDFSTEQKTELSIVVKIVQNIYFQIFITLLTLVSLVLYDLKTIFMSKEQDFSVGVANMVLFGIFMIEILMNIKTEGYFCSFYFYLDLISTVTLLLDVDIITDALFNQSSSSSFQVNTLIAKSKASRAAARAVRVVKIFRLARVAKLYKSTQKARELNEERKKEVKISLDKKKNGDSEQKETVNQGQGFKENLLMKESRVSQEEENFNRYSVQKDSIKEEEQMKGSEVIGRSQNLKNSALVLMEEKEKMSKILQRLSSSQESKEVQMQEIESKQSNISKILSNDTIKRIIIIILILMTSIPLMDVNNYLTITTHWDFMTSFILKTLQNKNITVSQINTLIDGNIKNFGDLGVISDILCFDTPFDQISFCPISDFSTYRTNDLGMFNQEVNVTEILSLRPELTVKDSQLSSMSENQIVVFLDYSRYNRLDAVFSIITTLFICLTIMYLLTSFSNNINQLVISPIQKMLELVKARDSSEIFVDKNEGDQKEEYETQMVQEAIIKIKKLMETIFGSLGNQLIQDKMQNSESIRLNIDQSIDKSLCVFVMCKINHIQLITDVLADDIFGFANEISMIVQNGAFRYGGYCTKIADDGFLLAFKIPKEQLILHKVYEDMDPKLLSKDLEPNENTYLNITSDFSVFTCLKILARLCKEPKIFKYRNDQRLLVSFKGSFNVEMSFALTLGWISTCIAGSSYKIDPIFFGPSITKLNKLMKFSKNRGSCIVVSDTLYENLTTPLKSYCRSFESVKFQEDGQKETVYMVDFDTINVTHSRKGVAGRKLKKKELKVKKEENMACMLPDQMENYDSEAFISNKKELREILKKMLTKEAIKKYKNAFEHYLKGEWTESLDLLQYDKLQRDPLAERLKAFIKSHNCVPPSGWSGYRNFNQLI